MKTEVRQLRELVGNKIFSVEFTKKNGSLRKMVCRLGVKKYLKGGELGYDAEALNYLTVFDLQSEEYRTINVNTLKSITFEGIKYEVE
jgi:hypothetical protein